jgi:ribonuclease VapC
MAKIVLDASAYLAMIKGEKGWARVAAVLPDAVMSSVNAAEIYAKLSEWQLTRDELAKYEALMEGLVVAFDNDLALRSGVLRKATRHLGLSLGDRACLALAQRLGVPVLTADQAWANAPSGIEIEIIR